MLNQNSVQPLPSIDSPISSQLPLLKSQISSQLNSINSLLTSLNHLKSLEKSMGECCKFIKQKQENSQDQLLSQGIICQYNPKYDYKFQVCDQRPILLARQNQLVSIVVETGKNNWIMEYLSNSNVRVFGKSHGAYVMILGENNGRIKYQRLRLNKQGQVDFQPIQQQIQQKSLNNFYPQNPELRVQFFKNNKLYIFNKSLVKLTLYNEQKTTIVVEVNHEKHRNCEQIRRVLIFKLQRVQKQNEHEEDDQEEEEMLLSSRNQKQSSKNNLKFQEQYRIFSGFYQDFDFIQHIQLGAGEYIFMPFDSSCLNLYTENEEQFDIVRFQQRQEIRQFNLMLQGFPSCHPSIIKAEYTRQCDLTKGIIIETYRNIYQNEIFFQCLPPVSPSTSSSPCPPQDKSLLFPTLYSNNHRSYRLKSQQIIVQFYALTRKPAILYQPQKKVIVDRVQDRGARTVHAILK